MCACVLLDVVLLRVPTGLGIHHTTSIAARLERLYVQHIYDKKLTLFRVVERNLTLRVRIETESHWIHWETQIFTRRHAVSNIVAPGDGYQSTGYVGVRFARRTNYASV